jgi:phage gpG-like protein
VARGFEGAGLGYSGVNSGVTFNFVPSMLVEAAGVETFGLSIRSFREPLGRVVRQVLAPSLTANFQASGRPEGWQPLQEATIAIKSASSASKGDPAAILQRSGLLMRTIGQINIWTVKRDTAEIDGLPDKIWYGIVHDQGISAGRAQIPSRPFLVFQDEDMDKAQDIFDRWLEERLVATWGRV